MKRLCIYLFIVVISLLVDNYIFIHDAGISYAVFPLAAAIIGGSILGGAGISALGQSSTNNTNVQLQRETNAQNYKIFREQLGFTEDMWNRQNIYNTPANQRKRYEAAGINPYMAMGNIDSGNASLATTPSAPSMVAPQVSNPWSTFGQGLANAGAGFVSGLQMEQNIANSKEIVKANQIDNLYRGIQHYMDLQHTSSQIANQLQQTKNGTAEYDKLLTEKKLIDGQIRTVALNNEYLGNTLTYRSDQERYKSRLLYNQNIGQQLANDYQSMQNAIFPDLSQAQIRTLLASAASSFASAHLSYKMSDTEVQKVANMVTENQINELKRNNIPVEQEQENALRRANINYLDQRNYFDLEDHYSIGHQLGGALSGLVGFGIGKVATPTPVKIKGF